MVRKHLSLYIYLTISTDPLDEHSRRAEKRFHPCHVDRLVDKPVRFAQD